MALSIVLPSKMICTYKSFYAVREFFSNDVAKGFPEAPPSQGLQDMVRGTRAAPEFFTENSADCW
jgi:hypothetical protein